MEIIEVLTICSSNGIKTDSFNRYFHIYFDDPEEQIDAVDGSMNTAK